MTSSGSEHNFDSTLLGLNPVQSRVVLLLQLEQAVAGSNKVVDELEISHAVLLGDRLTIGGAPMLAVGRADYIVFDLSGNSNDANAWPVL